MEESKIEVLKDINNKKVNKVIERLKLINPQNIDSDIISYIFLTPELGESAAGANGGVIFVEYNWNENRDFGEMTNVLLHEYIHIITKINELVFNIPEYKDFFNKKFPKSELQTNGAILEELFVYSVCQKYINYSDPIKKLINIRNLIHLNIVN